MAATFVKVTKLQNNGVTGGTTDVVSGAVSSTAGNALLAVAGAYYDASTAHAPTLAVSGGGTWTSHTPTDHHFSGNDNMCMGFASCPSATGGSQTITCTWTLNTTSASHIGTVWVYEFSGMATSAMLDLVGSGAFGASSPMTTGSLSNTNATDVMLAGGFTMSGSTETHGAPTNSWVMPAGADETNPTFLTGVSAYKIVSASAGQVTAWTLSPVPAGWLNYIIAFKQGAGATNFPLTRSVAQATAVTVAPVRTLRRTTSASQAQSLSIALAPSVTRMLARSVAQAQTASLTFRASIKYLLSGQATQGTSLSLDQIQARLPVNYYTSSFPLNENPISEGNVWLLGGRDGVDWTNPRTTPGKMFATQDGADSVFPSYKDSIAALRGTWGPDQEVILQIFNSLGNVPAYCEAEALLRFTIGARTVTGYEVTLNCNPLQNYIEINRWNGVVNGGAANYTNIGSVGGKVNQGDIIRATIVGSTINVYRNGTLILGPITDSTYTSGRPGAGFFYNQNGGTADITQWGISRFTAHTIGTPWPLGGSVLQGQTLGLAKQAQIRRTLPQGLVVSLVRAGRLSRLVGAPTAVSLVLPSRLVPITRAITQAQAASTTLVRGVIVRVLNASQGQSARLEQRVRLLRSLIAPQQAAIQVRNQSGGTIYGRSVTVASSTRASLAWSLVPLPPGPAAPDAPDLVPDTIPDTRAPQLARRPSGGAPPLLPYRPSGSR